MAHQLVMLGLEEEEILRGTSRRLKMIPKSLTKRYLAIFSNVKESLSPKFVVLKYHWSMWILPPFLFSITSLRRIMKQCFSKRKLFGTRKTKKIGWGWEARIQLSFMPKLLWEEKSIKFNLSSTSYSRKLLGMMFGSLWRMPLRVAPLIIRLMKL